MPVSELSSTAPAAGDADGTASGGRRPALLLESSHVLPHGLHRIGRLALPLALLWVLATSISQIARETACYWNDARLAPTIGMTRGYALYYPAEDGPVLNTIYPPLTALSYLPA